MKKEMLINVSQGEECRIALVEDGRLEELYMERTSATSHVGNIYKGRVTNVEPSIQAAFIDFGLGRNGFLHISDLMPSYFGEGNDFQETVGRKISRRDRPPIQRCLRRGDEIIVQIIKEGIGTKGPTLTTYLSIPGRILVMMPGMTKMGVSRKIERRFPTNVSLKTPSLTAPRRSSSNSCSGKSRGRVTSLPRGHQEKRISICPSLLTHNRSIRQSLISALANSFA